jgi:hypothetical protein
MSTFLRPCRCIAELLVDLHSKGRLPSERSTAFITIPGHIFIAFSTGVSPNEARKTFSRADDLIFRNEKSWVPVEVTVSAGFLRAWQDGAREWRENLSRNQVAFYPLHDAWQLYEPVGLPGAEVAVNLPP